MTSPTGFIPMLCALVAIGGPAGAAPARTGEIRQAFEAYDHGWRTYNPDEIIAAFAPDFEWTNEVGLRFTGKAALRGFLTKLFVQPNFRAGKPGPLVIRSIRLVAPDVAIVSSSEETNGQKVWDTGKTVPVLHTNELTVLQRQSGRWVIVSDLVSDESHGI